MWIKKKGTENTEGEEKLMKEEEYISKAVSKEGL